MKIYTKTGDKGETFLFGGRRVKKDDRRVEAYGSVDEANSVIGSARALAQDRKLLSELEPMFRRIQRELFYVGGDLANPKSLEKPSVDAAMVEQLEHWIDALSRELPPLRNFILPGGAPAAAALHHARSVVRRAERRVVALAHEEEVPEVLIRYLNRLSDLLFVMARWVNHRLGVPDIPVE